MEYAVQVLKDKKQELNDHIKSLRRLPERDRCPVAMRNAMAQRDRLVRSLDEAVKLLQEARYA